MEDAPKVEPGQFPNVPTWSVRLVRDRVSIFRTRASQQRAVFACAADIYALVKRYLSSLTAEEFWVIVCDVKNAVRGVAMVSRGILDASLTHPREVFRIALLTGMAASVIFVHNHPSGDPEPSVEDIALTKRLAEAGTILGIPVLDHVVVGARGYVSFAERGLV